MRGGATSGAGGWSGGERGPRRLLRRPRRLLRRPPCIAWLVLHGLYACPTFFRVSDVEPWMSGNARGPSTAFNLLYRLGQVGTRWAGVSVRGGQV